MTIYLGNPKKDVCWRAQGKSGRRRRNRGKMDGSIFRSLRQRRKINKRT